MARPPDAEIDALVPRIFSLSRQAKLSARKIGRTLHISRATVLRILHHQRATRPAHPAPKPPPYCPALPLKWCSTCRRPTPSPCVICAARTWRLRHGLPL